MESAQEKVHQLTLSYHGQFNQDPKWTSFKENILPTLVSLKCHFCKHNFSSEYSLKRHYASIHLDKLPSRVFYSSTQEFRCDDCNKSFSRQDKLNEHRINSKQHKQAVLSRSNCVATIDRMMMLTANKSLKRKQESEDDIIVIATKKPRKDVSDELPNQEVTDNNNMNNESNALTAPIDPMTIQLDKLNKEQLHDIFNRLMQTYVKVQRQVIFVRARMLKFQKKNS